jgi:hypothetical protein
MIMSVEQADSFAANIYFHSEITISAWPVWEKTNKKTFPEVRPDERREKISRVEKTKMEICLQSLEKEEICF